MSRRTCKTCPTILTSYNPQPCCYLCQAKGDQVRLFEKAGDRPHRVLKILTGPMRATEVAARALIPPDQIHKTLSRMLKSGTVTKTRNGHDVRWERATA